MNAELIERQEALPASEPIALMHIIERAATDPNMDIAKLERLLELKRQWDAEEARKAFAASMANVQGRIQPVIADADNLQTNSKYAKMEKIVTVLAPIYTAEGFSVSYGTEDCTSQRLAEAGWFRTTSELTHTSGHTKHYHVDLPPDTTGPKGNVNKTMIHGTKSAISYARVILMGLMFNFTTSLDVDDDGNGAGKKKEPNPDDEPATDEQLAMIKDYRDAEQIPDITLKWLDKQENLTVKQAATLIIKLKKANK